MWQFEFNMQYISWLDNELVQSVSFLDCYNELILLFYDHATVTTVILWPCDFPIDPKGILKFTVIGYSDFLFHMLQGSPVFDYNLLLDLFFSCNKADHHALLCN
jgi:hypothetical protein